MTRVIKVNVWRSTLTEEIYTMPIDWVPKYDGWVFVATIEEEIDD